MMFKSPILSSLAITTIALTTTHTNISYAAASFGPPVRAMVHLNAPSHNSHKSAFGDQTSAQPENKPIVLMNLKLTAKDKQTFADQANFVKNLDNKDVTTNDASLPSRVELGMANVPVLDQGDNGTCVTFATTAAMNAVLNKGNYISQLCSLELGTYLANRSHGQRYSGWDGSFATRVLGNFTQFGIVTIDQQRANSCGGLREYPGVGMDIGNEMSLEDYHKLSIDNPLHWYSMLTIEQRFYSNVDKNELSTTTFNNVKKILASADAKHPLRLAIGALLPVDYCSVGACGKYHATNDTWALTKTMISDLMKNPANVNFGGHEMVLTGYDDNAVAIDNEGGKHKGLFFLRNSWSERAGDKGDYYMTYDYFKVFVDEVTVIAASSAGNSEASN